MKKKIKVLSIVAVAALTAVFAATPSQATNHSMFSGDGNDIHHNCGR